MHAGGHVCTTEPENACSCAACAEFRKLHHNRPGREHQTPKSTHMLNASRGESGRVDPRARRGLCTQPPSQHSHKPCVTLRHDVKSWDTPRPQQYLQNRDGGFNLSRGCGARLSDERTVMSYCVAGVDGQKMRTLVTDKAHVGEVASSKSPMSLCAEYVTGCTSEGKGK
jgi:hypothetical protein